MRLLYSGGIFDWDVAVKRLEELNALVENPDLWNDSENAQKIMRERTLLEDQISAVRELETRLNDNIELIAMGQ